MRRTPDKDVTGAKDVLILSIDRDNRHDHIVIGGRIKVYFCGIHGNRVVLGIDAPRDVIVDRAKVRRSKLEDARKVTK